MTSSTHFYPAVLVLALAAACHQQAAAATSAGVVQFISGDVNVRGSDGKTDALVKGKEIESGQAIVTGANGRAQVKFSDDGMISLQPNTEFKIANYVDKADPKEDRFLVALLRGSMRAITGMIGKRNRANYKVTTTTATIGIRGSGFSAGYNPDGSLSVTAEKDAIEVCSGGVCVGLVAGESVRVNDSSESPVRTVNRATVPTPGNAQEVVTAGNQTTSDGKSPLAKSLVNEPVTRLFADIQVSAVGSDSSLYSQQLATSPPSTAVFTNNKLIEFSDTSSGNQKWVESGTPAPLASFKSIGNVTDPNFIGWGMWNKATVNNTSGSQLLDQVHYVAGRQAPDADLYNLSGYSFDYNLIGSTAPTMNGVVGTLISASLNINYAVSYSVTLAVNTSFGPIAGYASSSTTSFNSSYDGFKGMLIGSNAAFAGVTYAKDLGQGTVTGAIAFQKGACTGCN